MKDFLRISALAVVGLASVVQADNHAHVDIHARGGLEDILEALSDGALAGQGTKGEGEKAKGGEVTGSIAAAPVLEALIAAANGHATSTTGGETTVRISQEEGEDEEEGDEPVQPSFLTMTVYHTGEPPKVTEAPIPPMATQRYPITVSHGNATLADNATVGVNMPEEAKVTPAACVPKGNPEGGDVSGEVATDSGAAFINSATLTTAAIISQAPGAATIVGQEAGAAESPTPTPIINQEPGNAEEPAAAINSATLTTAAIISQGPPAVESGPAAIINQEPGAVESGPAAIASQEPGAAGSNEAAIINQEPPAVESATPINSATLTTAAIISQPPGAAKSATPIASEPPVGAPGALVAGVGGTSASGQCDCQCFCKADAFANPVVAPGNMGGMRPASTFQTVPSSSKPPTTIVPPAGEVSSPTITGVPGNETAQNPPVSAPDAATSTSDGASPASTTEPIAPDATSPSQPPNREPNVPDATPAPNEGAASSPPGASSPPNFFTISPDATTSSSDPLITDPSASSSGSVYFTIAPDAASSSEPLPTDTNAPNAPDQAALTSTPTLETGPVPLAAAQSAVTEPSSALNFQLSPGQPTPVPLAAQPQPEPINISTFDLMSSLQLGNLASPTIVPQ